MFTFLSNFNYTLLEMNELTILMINEKKVISFSDGKWMLGGMCTVASCSFYSSLLRFICMENNYCF